MDPERRDVTDDDILRHLAGLDTIGFYVVNPAGTVQSAVLDIDCPKEMLERDEYGAEAKREQLEAARALIDATEKLFGSTPLIEVSGRKGLHLWIVFKARVAARIARLGCERVLEEAGFRKSVRGVWIAEGLPAARVELFPKQDSLRPGEVGNLVKLPLGVHQVTGQRSYLLDRRLHRVTDPLPLLEAVWQ